MSNYIVLVKQVPDVSQITDNAFNPETGTLIRTRLENVINELDAQAFAFTHMMRRKSGDESGKIVCLTMGPPMAEEVLRYGLSRYADVAVLLTDRALGGADTVATANPLAFACRKIVKDIFKGDEDYFIVSGMQSVDGDTAQVPPQMAEELKLPIIAYATAVECRGGEFEFTRIISGGSQVVKAKKTPAVVTVAKYDYPMYAGFSQTRKANSVEVVAWTANDINADAVGVKGSKTRVIRVFPPGKSTRKCQQVNNVADFVKIIVEKGGEAGSGGSAGESDTFKHYVLPASRSDMLDRSFEATEKEINDYALLADKLKQLGVTGPEKIDDVVKKKVLEAADGAFHEKALEDMIAGLKLAEPSYKGEVWVMAEHRGGVMHPSTFELIGKARDLADSLETKVGVCLPGHGVGAMTAELIAAGADIVYVIEHKLLAEFDPTSFQKAVADAVKKYMPQIMLYAATPQGRMLAPMVSYRVGCGLTADCTSLHINDSSRKGEIGILLQTRPALGGNVMATICTKDSPCQMATARPGVMKRLDADASRKGKVVEHKVDIAESDITLEVISTELAAGEVNFEADAIVAGGKGMQNRDVFERMTGALCDAIGKRLEISVERGASRAAVEQGWVERVHQVGQTGTAVGPKLYFALGISGAIQHMIGVANTETIFAINSDPDAPIFKQCDYYMVGSIEDIVPQMVQALEG